jgi:hypothetical protein
MAESAPPQPGLSSLLTLSDGFEAQYWSSASTESHILLWDIVGLTLGFAIHMVADIQKVSVFWYCKPYIYIGPGLQMLQLVWATSHPSSYIKWRLPSTLVQRLRWLGMAILIELYVPWDMIMYRALAVDVSSSGPLGAWSALQQSVTALSFPAIFVMMVHGLPFRLQAAAAAIQVLAHARLGVPHQRQVIAHMGLQPQLSSLCNSFCVVLDPSMAYPMLTVSPSWCESPTFQAWFLSYLHTVLVFIIPLHFLHRAEYNSKVRFLCTQERVAASTDGLLQWYREQYPIKTFSHCCMQCWAACSLAWCLLIVVYASHLWLAGSR